LKADLIGQLIEFYDDQTFECLEPPKDQLEAW
jgi:hypothetical protein